MFSIWISLWNPCYRWGNSYISVSRQRQLWFWLSCAPRQRGNFGTETAMSCKTKLRAPNLELDKEMTQSCLSGLLLKCKESGVFAHWQCSTEQKGGESPQVYNGCVMC